MARRVDMLTFTATLALVLLSVPSSYGQTAACTNKVNECTSMVGSGIPDRNSAFLTLFCSSVLPNLEECVNQAKSVCTDPNKLSELDDTLVSLGVLCGGGESAQCPGVYSCFTTVTYANMACSTLTTVLNCVKGKVQEGSCNVDQSGLSYSDLETMVYYLCIELRGFSNFYHICGALNRCMLTGLGVTQSSSDSATLVYLTSKLISPKGMCRYIKIGTGCYESQASACGYPQSLVSTMTAQHTKFNNRCPKSINGSTGQTVPAMLLSLAVIIALLFF